MNLCRSGKANAYLSWPRKLRTELIHIAKINLTFLREGATPGEYGAALDYAIAQGWLWKHESGTYVKFTQAGADLFA